jgi:hypothetical protein
MTDIRPLPKGRWRAASKRAWEAWGELPIADEWSDADWNAVERLLQLTNDLDAATDASERRLLSTTVRTLERDLGILRRKKPPDPAHPPRRELRPAVTEQRAPYVPTCVLALGDKAVADWLTPGQDPRSRLDEDGWAREWRESVNV